MNVGEWTHEILSFLVAFEHEMFALCEVTEPKTSAARSLISTILSATESENWDRDPGPM